MSEFTKLLGVAPIFGGIHLTFGTKNALINLGNQTYLELLATDIENKRIAPPRWMGVDVLTKDQITRWALKSNTLNTDGALLKKYHKHMGNIRSGSRNISDALQLQWQLTMPLPKPEVEILPFFLDWNFSEKHPTELLPDMGCELLDFYATHPNPKSFEAVFKKIQFPIKIQKSDTIRLKARIKTPNGIVSV